MQNIYDRIIAFFQLLNTTFRKELPSEPWTVLLDPDLVYDSLVIRVDYDLVSPGALENNGAKLVISTPLFGPTEIPLEENDMTRIFLVNVAEEIPAVGVATSQANSIDVFFSPAASDRALAKSGVRYRSI